MTIDIRLTISKSVTLILFINNMEKYISQRGKERQHRKGKIKGTFNCGLRKGGRYEVFSEVVIP